MLTFQDRIDKDQKVQPAPGLQGPPELGKCLYGPYKIFFCTAQTPYRFYLVRVLYGCVRLCPVCTAGSKMTVAH